LDCYERGSEIVEVLMNVKTNDASIYRITDKIGEECEQFTESESFRKPLELTLDEYLCIQSDGSMLLTREEGWKEVKLGRVFNSSSLLSETESRNWISAEYPQSILILDFYHAMENIGKYVSLGVHKKEIGPCTEKLGRELKEKGVPEILSMLSTIPPKTPIQKEKYEALMKYISNNRERMHYPKYISEGLLIGSGAIESAHRTVLQRRMKQSGQRWTKQGLKNIINLRVVNMSGYWDKIRELIKNAA
jgi:hypothetical protein